MLRTIFVFLFISLSQSVYSQTYKLTHFMLTVNSRPQAYEGPLLVVGDTFLSNINEVKNGDSTEIKVQKERILRNKKGYLVQTAINGGACNYYFEPSENKQEKKAGIYDITMEIVMNNGSRKDLFFRGIKTEEKKGAKK